MFKMSAFGVDTGSQTTLPLISGVIHSPTTRNKFMQVIESFLLACKNATSLSVFNRFSMPRSLCFALGRV